MANPRSDASQKAEALLWADAEMTAAQAANLSGLSSANSITSQPWYRAILDSRRPRCEHCGLPTDQRTGGIK